MKKIRLSMVFALVVLLSLGTSCKSQYQLLLQGHDVEAKYKAAFNYFESKKYTKSADLFESLVLETKGTPREDTVHFYWGYSNYRFGDYTTAESNLSQFVSVFPISPFTQYAKFLCVDCLYKATYRYELDQRPTYKALQSINQFMIENPDSEHIEECKIMKDDLLNRLELKAYKSAYLYYHMEDYLAAHYALKNVLKENADNRYREEILYYTAMAAYKYASMSVESKKKERYLMFVDDYFNMVSEYPDSDMRKKLDGLYEKSQEYLKKDN